MEKIIKNLKAADVEAAKRRLGESFPDAYRIEGPLFEKTPAVEKKVVVPVNLEAVDYAGEKYYAILTDDEDGVNLTADPYEEFGYRESVDVAIADAKRNHPSLTEAGMVERTIVVQEARDIDGTGWVQAIMPGTERDIMKTLVVMNEQHSLLPDQERVLNENLRGGWELYPVPAEGWTLAEMREKVMGDLFSAPVVFVSPVPALILWLGAARGGCDVMVMHNDHRVAKELPGGRVIHTVAPEGWVLV